MEEMPASKAALELFEPLFVIGGSKPITRCTASADARDKIGDDRGSLRPVKRREYQS